MYWYLSFLRPPPISVPSTATDIQITPQIANDLRTERYDPVGIGYIWQRIFPTRYDTPAEFLTIWEPPGSTYKPLSVALPPDRSGESWRLGLVPLQADGPSTPSLSSYCRPEPGIVPVWSGPIAVTAPDPRTSSVGPIRQAKGSHVKVKADDKVSKQDRIQREWTAGDGVIKLIEQTSFDLDKKIWDSGLALSSWLWSHLVESLPSPVKSIEPVLRALREPRSKPLRVLELGGGTGLVSIVLQRIAETLDRDTDITSTDLESAIPLMDENIALNATPSGNKVKARVLDWDQPLPDWVAGATPSWPNLIIAADVTYNTASFPSLLRTITALLNPPRHASPSLLLAYKQRDPAERQLWVMLQDAGVRMEKVDVVQGAEEEGAVEIWLGRYEKPP